MEPTILYARPKGFLQFECPNCGNLNGTRRIKKHTERVLCGRCNFKFGIGVGFFLGVGPADAVYNDSWDGEYANFINPQGRRIKGRLFSILDFRCPTCETINSDRVEFNNQTITCSKCHDPWGVQLIIHTPIKGIRVHLPLDWSIPYVQDPLNPPPPAPSRQSARKAS